MDRTKQQLPPTHFEDFSRQLKYRLRNVPPKSRLILEIVTNDEGEIHNHRFTLTEDKGPLSLTFN